MTQKFYKPITFSTILIFKLKAKDNDVFNNVIVKRLHIDKRNNNAKVFFNSKDVEEFNIKTGRVTIYDYGKNITFTARISKWRTGSQLLINNAITEAIELSKKRYLGLKFDNERNRIIIFRFIDKMERYLDTLFNKINDNVSINND